MNTAESIDVRERKLFRDKQIGEEEPDRIVKEGIQITEAELTTSVETSLPVAIPEDTNNPILSTEQERGVESNILLPTQEELLELLALSNEQLVRTIVLMLQEAL
jgi:hypothetical protein